MSKPAHDFHWSHSGRKIRGPLETPPEDIVIEDIAVGLAYLIRFRGMTGKTYTVAEHSVLCAKHFLNLGDIPTARAALLHDAHEAYTGDIVSPQKRHIPGWREYETAWEIKVRSALGLPPQDDPVWAKVDVVDKAMVHREARLLFPGHVPWWDINTDALVDPRVKPLPRSSEQALGYFNAACSLLL
jgi:hypothetical protein